jgi:hypothetical protein
MRLQKRVHINNKIETEAAYGLVYLGENYSLTKIPAAQIGHC